MAQYMHLEIYKKSFEFLIYYSNLFSNFHREYKYTLGENLLNRILEFIVLIYKANDSKTSELRIEYLNQMSDKIRHIDLMLRLSCALKNISKDKYIYCVTFTGDIERQLSGWLNYTMKPESQKTSKSKQKTKGVSNHPENKDAAKNAPIEQQMLFCVPLEEAGI